MNIKKLKITILSMSILTVMAGAAVSPALGNIKEYFSGVDDILIKMILTIPGLFIMLVSLIFPLILNKFNVKHIALIGIGLYTLGGLLGAFMNDIYMLLFTRVLLGCGVGLIMPLSTGLLAYYFDQSEQSRLMGYSVAMNNLGGIIAMSLSGYLASISWNYSFFVYLLGLIAFILVILFLPKDRIKGTESTVDIKLIRKKITPLLSMFLMMVAFYTYITNFSIQATSENIIASNQVGVVMSFQSVGAMLLALCFGAMTKKAGKNIKYLGLLLFMVSFILLLVLNTSVGYMLALALCGAGMGISLPQINSTATQGMDRELAPSIMAMMSVAMYLGQFISPILSGYIMKTFSITLVRFPYTLAIVSTMTVIIITALSDIRLTSKTAIDSVKSNV